MSTTKPLTPIHKTLEVEASPETAFETFTRRIGTWWPTDHYSIHEQAVHEVVFEERAGGRVYERSATGEEVEWADVIAWEPPQRLVLRWRVNPQRPPTEIEVRFAPEDGITRVELEHRGWERTGDEAGHANYESGWEEVLAPYVDSFSR